MAGGKGKRIGLPLEKPLLPFLGKPLIDWVADAVLDAGRVSDFYAVTSPNTLETEKHCQQMSWKTIRTDAKGYHIDLKQATREANLMGPVLTIPADSPALTGKFLDKVVALFEECKMDFYAVFVPIAARQKLGLSIDSTDEYNGMWYAVSGINVINGAKSQTEDKIETCALVTDEAEVLLNINTPKDLEIAEKIMKSRPPI